MRQLLALTLMVVPLAGCSLDQRLPEKKRFILALEDPGRLERAGSGGTLRVHRFRASPIFERRSLVYRVAHDRFEEDFYNEFYAQPGVMVREVTIRYLRDAGIFDFVLEANDPRQADWLLSGRVENLYADLLDRERPVAHLDVEFTLVDENSADLEVTFQRRYSEEIPAESARPHDLVRALSRGMGAILVRLALDLRETSQLRKQEAAPPEPRETPR